MIDVRREEWRAETLAIRKARNAEILAKMDAEKAENSKRISEYFKAKTGKKVL